MLAVAQLQIGAAVLVNAAFAWLVGATCARWWIRGANEQWRRPLLVRIRFSEMLATVLGVLASAGALWAAAAVMSGQTLAQSAGSLWPMVSETSYGHAAVASVLILVAFGIVSFSSSATRMRDAVALALLLAFAVSRAANSHAGESGVFGGEFVVELVHLLLVAFWAGGVALCGWLFLPVARFPKVSDSTERYLSTLSRGSTFALAGVFATGLFNAYHRLGTIDNLTGNTYSTALTWKLALVLLAAALGAYNKFVGFPSIGRSAVRTTVVVAVLRVESMILLAAFVAAASLTSQQPPASF
jgi:putative copper resistance protein D